MKLDFIKLNPSENTTVLITNYVRAEDYPAIARKIMSYTYPGAEQVGFITRPVNEDSIVRLEMAAGEFCGNGVLAAGAVVKYLNLTDKKKFKLESSGTVKQLDCQIERIDNRTFNVRSTMPLNYSYDDYSLQYRNRPVAGVLVGLEGITHFFIEDKQGYSRDFLENAAVNIAEKTKSKAVGIIPYQNKEKLSIRPFVYVPEIDSFYFERGCGSGTLGLGLYFAHQSSKSIDIAVEQPGGVIKTEIVGKKEKEGGFIAEKGYIETRVEITCEGRILI